MEASAGIPGNKRQRTQKNAAKKPGEAYFLQLGTYAAEKFSDSFSNSHVLNLLVKGENQCAHKRLRQLTWIPR